MLKRSTGDGPAAKDLTEFNTKKREVARLKDKINAAVKEQKNDQRDVDQVLHDVMEMDAQLQKKLDGKKESADLSNAVQNFAAAAAQAGVPETASSVTD